MLHDVRFIRIDKRQCNRRKLQSITNINHMNYETAQQAAINFLLTFTRSDFSDLSVYNRMKAYRSRHKAGTLPKGGYENILNYLGYGKTETWQAPEKESDLLIDILTSDAK